MAVTNCAPSSTLRASHGRGSLWAFAENMTHDTEAGYWGQSRWPKSEIHDKTIDCNWRTETEKIIGFGTLIVKESPDGRQKIQVNVPMASDGGVIGERVIFFPPRFFDRIQKNPDPSESDYIFHSTQAG